MQPGLLENALADAVGGNRQHPRPEAVRLTFVPLCLHRCSDRASCGGSGRCDRSGSRTYSSRERLRAFFQTYALDVIERTQFKRINLQHTHPSMPASHLRIEPSVTREITVFAPTESSYFAHEKNRSYRFCGHDRIVDLPIRFAFVHPHSSSLQWAAAFPATST